MSKMNPREDVYGLTDDYVHGVLGEEDARFVEEQAERSAVWKAALEEARVRAASLGEVPQREPSEAMLQRAFASAIAEERQSTRKDRFFTRTLPVVFAVAAVILVFAQIYFTSLVPKGYELTVLGQTTLTAGGPASVRVRLIDRAAGTPVAGAPVEISLMRPGNDEVMLAKFTTDARGTGSPRYVLPDWKEGDYTIRVAAAGRESIERTVKLERPTRVMLSTDKPVYQPGQTIHARGLVLRRADGKPMGGQEAIFTIADPKGTIIFKQRTATSTFGISAADCPLAEEIIEGAYTLRYSVAGIETQRTLDVRKYVLPKFRVEIGVDEPFLRPGQVVRARVSAGYFFGQPVDGGTAEVEISIPESGFRLRQTVELDREGKGRAEFRLPERLAGTEADQGDAKLLISARVVDAAGQAESRAATRIVSSRDLRIEAVPESGELMPGIANRVYVLVTTPDGRPASGARLAIVGVDRELVASEMGVASFEITPSATASRNSDQEVMITVTATDAAGRTASRSVNLARRTVAGDFLMRADRATYEAGGTISLRLFGAGTQPVFIDLLKDNQTVLTQVVDMKDGGGELTFDLPAELTGTIEMVAYRFDALGVSARRTRTIVITGGDELRVEVKTDKTQYRPGEKATIQIGVSGSDGRAAPGAISLAAVDEAVFAVSDQAPGMERTMLMLNDELLKPVYSIYPWTMTRNGSTQEREFERAIFSTTAQGRVGRSAALWQLVESGAIDSEMLEVLESPRAERMIAELETSGAMTREAAALLRSGGASFAHPLSASTWPAKVQKVKEQRRTGMELVNIGWVGIGIAFGIFVIVLLGLYAHSRIVEVIFVLFVLALLIGLLLPALGKARASSRSGRERSMLGSIASALEFRGSEENTRFGIDESAPKPSAPARVREWFPETLLWRPEIITDDAGHATVEVDLADSITTWRLLGSAITREGRLGSLEGKLAVFQPFFVDVNVPRSVSRGDEISVPVVVYNYLDSPQKVNVAVKATDWFELTGAMTPENQMVEVPAKGVRSLGIRIKVKRAGVQEFEVGALSDAPNSGADAIRRTVEVLPGGRPIERVASGSLSAALETTIDVPADVIEGSGRLTLKVYPSPLSQIVDGLEGIFQSPHGCFEQTSSTTYPNVLALSYLKQSGKAVPSIEAKARQFIHLGYQRLVSFEVAGGGFDWFGRPPSNRLLTAYGLMEFVDMAKVHDVDPALIDRTRRWLLAQRRSDGAWAPESHGLESGATSHRSADADLMTTAYISWAAFNASNRSDAGSTRAWLESIRPESQRDPYIVALMMQALSAVGSDATRWSRQLVEARHQSDDGKLVWWTRSEGARTAFYGSGESGDIETTALAALALLERRAEPAIARGALAWLTERRDGRGTWGTTQATVLALKALVASAEAPLGEPVDREISVLVDGRPAERFLIEADQAEVLKLVDLSKFATTGMRRISVRQERGPAALAQVVFRASVPGEAGMANPESPLAVSVQYDRNSLRVGEELQATAALSTTTASAIPMVMLELPIPPGFEPKRREFEAMVASGKIARFEITSRAVIVYLTKLAPGVGLTLEYRMRATMPVNVRVEGPNAYEYYNPQNARRGEGIEIRVEESM